MHEQRTAADKEASKDSDGIVRHRPECGEYARMDNHSGWVCIVSRDQ